jgi:hypothetical protein
MIAPVNHRRKETGTDLWGVIFGPTVWALHFLVAYVWGAVHCAKAGRDAETGFAASGIVAASVVALVLIGAATLRLWRVRARSLTDNDFDFDHNTPEERHRFLSHVALMLCALSAIGVVFVTLPVLIIGSCR